MCYVPTIPSILVSDVGMISMQIDFFFHKSGLIVSRYNKYDEPWEKRETNKRIENLIRKIVGTTRDPEKYGDYEEENRERIEAKTGAYEANTKKPRYSI